MRFSSPFLTLLSPSCSKISALSRQQYGEDGSEIPTAPAHFWRLCHEKRNQYKESELENWSLSWQHSCRCLYVEFTPFISYRIILFSYTP